MTTSDPKTITRLLHGVRAGEPDAAGRLLPIVYSELRSLAGALFARETSGHTLQPTALIHEAWLKLAAHLDGIEDRRHFFALASQAMRQVLTDHARKLRAAKRRGEARQVTLDEALVSSPNHGPDLVDLDDSLRRLASLNARHARMVELRLFGGLTIPETAQTLELSHATVERDWFTIRAWLRRELSQAR